MGGNCGSVRECCLRSIADVGQIEGHETTGKICMRRELDEVARQLLCIRRVADKVRLLQGRGDVAKQAVIGRQTNFEHWYVRV